MSSSSVLVLDGAETAAALDPVEVLSAVRTALVAISDDAVSAPPRIFARTPAGILGCMPAFVPGVGLAAKLVSVFDAPGADGHRGRSTHFGLVALFDETDGRPLVIMEGGRITAVRTAAAATLSMQALAPDPSRIAIVGTGVQARAQLALLTSLGTTAEVVIGAPRPRGAPARWPPARLGPRSPRSATPCATPTSSSAAPARPSP